MLAVFLFGCFVFGVSLLVVKCGRNNSFKISESTSIRNVKTHTESRWDMDAVLLNRSLKNLEYINQFEHYMSCERHTYFSTDFLEKFNQLKFEAQLVTLNTTQVLLKQSA